MRDMQDDIPVMRESRRRGEPDTERVTALACKLQDEADSRVRLRSAIEQRWIEDLRQFHGQYDDEIKRRLGVGVAARSTLNMNLTRIKTNTLSARLIDLLFPTDDRHWGIGPTPVPEMDKVEDELQDQMDGAKKGVVEADATFDEVAKSADLSEEAEVSPELAQAGAAQDAAQAEVDVLQEALDDLSELRSKAKQSAELMQEEIDDQLKACRYQAQCRDVIDDACRIGVGIMKGPVLGETIHNRWRGGDGVYELGQVQDLRPAFKRVDPWAFFPDMNARTPEESEGFFERHLMNKKQLRKLARRDDMDKDAIRELLKADPAEKSPANMSQLFSINGDETHDVKGKYQVWEYSGPIEPDDLATLVDVYEDFDTADAMQEIDPLQEINVKIWFCQNEVLSFSLHPMDSGEPIYSVFNVEKSETSVFGYGVPRIMRDPQSSLNAAWRLMMDNARVAAGPQVVMAKDKVSPQDRTSDYTLEPFKLWEAKDGNGQNPPFSVFHIEMNQGLIANIIEMSRRAIDEVTGLPMMAQGEPGTMPQQTATGMSILHNAANVVTRRIVKNWDDDITVPNIRRIYDFNMQFSEKEAIKGDYEVDARGSSVLLSRELMGPNLMVMAERLGENPRYADRIDDEAMLKEIFKANSIPSTGIILSEREYVAAQEKRAQMETPDPMVGIKESEIEVKREEIEARTAIAEMESHARMKVAQLNYDAAMEKVTVDANLRDEEREDRSGSKQAEIDMKERNMAIEVAMRERTGKSAGGNV